jgi:hypothetical protein
VPKIAHIGNFTVFFKILYDLKVSNYSRASGRFTCGIYSRESGPGLVLQMLVRPAVARIRALCQLTE